MSCWCCFVWCHYNKVYFVQNNSDRNLIVRPSGRVMHHTDVTFESWHLKSPPTRTFNRLENISVPPYWPFVEGFRCLPMDSPTKDQWCGKSFHSESQNEVSIRSSASNIRCKLVSALLLSIPCYFGPCYNGTPIYAIHMSAALLWRHNGHSSVSNHQPYDCLHSPLFRRRSK